MAIAARHVRIFGRVQGVWYRGWTVETARALGLAGWVRNRADASVEAHVEGQNVDVARFLQLAWSGPSTARVADVRDEPAAVERFADFQQRPTSQRPPGKPR